jgi:sortase (surface protein transpeptidase)
MPTAARPPAHRPRSLPGTASGPPRPGLTPGILGHPGRSLPAPATPGGVTGTPATATPSPPGVPVRLRIPALGIDAHTESVGLSGANMAVPASAWDVAWFKLGPRPGLAGNAVIDGHLDTATGPAIFLRLEALAPGDLLYVRDSYGVERAFKVTALASYVDSKAPLALIFGPSSVPHLNLITCAGTWQMDQKNYSQRLVVYTTLVA